MIIIRGNKFDEATNASFTIKQTEAGFLLTDQRSGKAFEFDKTKLEFHPDIAYLTNNIWGAPVLFWQSEIGHTRDGYSSICLRKKINLSALQSSYAMFCVDASGEAHAIVYGDTFVEDSVTPIVTVSVDGNETGCDLFERLIPGIDGFMKHSRAKVQALARFNAVDAIAGLEYQIDLLTAAVKALVDELPAEKKPSWWPQFEAAVLSNASFNLLNELKAVQKIDEEKAKARATQVAYYQQLTGEK